MNPQVVGLLLVTFVTLLKTTNGQAPMYNNFFGQGGMLDVECYERPYQTSCAGPIPRFFYNATDQKCEEISNVCGHGGFFSVQECDNKCTCRLPPAAGTNTCHGAVDSQRFFFNQNIDICLPFTYYGCEGNGNNFASAAECTTRCNAPREIEQGDVMRRMGYTSERQFEMQAGLFNYGAPPPPPPPRPKAPVPPPPSPPHQPPPFPPRHRPSPPPAGRFTPTASWNNPRPTFRPRWQPPPPPPTPRSTYRPHMRSPRPPPNVQSPFGNQPMNRQLIQPPPPPGASNTRGNGNPIAHSFSKTTFSMNNIQDKLKKFTRNPLSRQGPGNNRGGMNWNRPNQGQMNQMLRNMGSQVTIAPTPIVSMAPTTVTPMRNNWLGRINQGHQGHPRSQHKPENSKIATKPTAKQSDQSALKQPMVNVVKVTTTQASAGFNNGGTTDYYYYDNTGYNSQGTTASYYNNAQSAWGAVGRRVGK